MKNKILVSVGIVFLQVSVLFTEVKPEVAEKQSAEVTAPEQKDSKNNAAASTPVSQSNLPIEAKTSEKPVVVQDEAMASTVSSVNATKKEESKSGDNQEAIYNDLVQGFNEFAEKTKQFVLKKGYGVFKKTSNGFNDSYVWLEDKIHDCCTQDDPCTTFTSEDYKQLSEKYHSFVDETSKKFKDFKQDVLKVINELDTEEDAKKEIETSKKEIETSKKEVELLNKKISNLQMGIVVGLVGFIAYEAVKYYRNSDNSDK